MTQEQSTVVTPMFRASYVKLFDPQTNDNDQLVWSVTMIFDPKEDLSGLKDLVQQAKIKKFGKNFQGKLRNPIRKGTPEEFDLNRHPEYEGNIIIAARSYGQPPSVVDRDRNPILNKAQVYSGCYGIAVISAYGYDTKGNKGVTIGLQHFMKVKDGKPLVSRTSPKKAFESVSLPPESDPSDDFFGDNEDEL